MGKILLEQTPLKKWAALLHSINLCKWLYGKQKKLGEMFLKLCGKDFFSAKNNTFTDRKQSGLYSSTSEQLLTAFKDVKWQIQ